MKRTTALLAVAGIALVAAPSAFAGVATYNSTEVPKFVGDGATVSSTLAVPSGRTPIQSLEVTNLGYTWPASGQELSAQLLSPDGGNIFLFTKGCFDYPSNSSFRISDAGTAPADGSDARCTDAFLIGGALTPFNAGNKRMSYFDGRGASGTWTLRSIDNGVSFTNQGSLLRWGIRVVHEPPTLTATAPKSAKAGKKLTLTAKSNADGDLVTGGGAKRATTRLTAGKTTSVSYKPTKKVLGKVAKKGKARLNVSLEFIDETGGKTTSSVAVTLKG